MEKSESGAPIYRYENNEDPSFKAPSGDSSLEEISAHIEKHVGEIDMVFHELVSDKVHLDIHWVKPTKEKPFHTLVTSGMSDLQMNVPEGYDAGTFVELSICLPESWKISEKDFEDENNYWPLRWLKVMARFPHDYNSWLSIGHTIPNGDPATPFAQNTQMNSMLLFPSLIFDEGFQHLELDSKTIHFYTLIPLHQDELEMKLNNGLESLYEGFDKHNVTDILDVSRPSSLKRKKRFGLF